MLGTPFTGQLSVRRLRAEMKAVCHECGKYKEVSAWLPRPWTGGDEEYDPICEECYRDVTGKTDQEAEAPR